MDMENRGIVGGVLYIATHNIYISSGLCGFGEGFYVFPL